MAFLQMPAPPYSAACLWSACILWMHWVFVSKFAPANLQLRGSAITLETKAPIYTLYSSSLFGYPIIPLLKFLSFALSSKPPFEQKPLLPLNLLSNSNTARFFNFGQSTVSSLDLDCSYSLFTCSSYSLFAVSLYVLFSLFGVFPFLSYYLSTLG